jgi:hypothetical protein
MFLVNGLIDKSIAYSLLVVDTSSSFVSFNKAHQKNRRPAAPPTDTPKSH